MAWMLWIVDQLYQIDVIKLALMGVKSGGSALATYLLKRIWSKIMRPKNENSCLIEGCSNFKSNGMKGLCSRCYREAKKRIDAGETTWDQLEGMGLCENPENPFSQAFNKAKESQ